MPEGVTEAYRKWVEAGWGSVAVPKEHGGQGLPFGALHGASPRCGTAPTWRSGSVRC